VGSQRNTVTRSAGRRSATATTAYTLTPEQADRAQQSYDFARHFTDQSLYNYGDYKTDAARKAAARAGYQPITHDDINQLVQSHALDHKGKLSAEVAATIANTTADMSGRQSRLADVLAKPYPGLSAHEAARATYQEVQRYNREGSRYQFPAMASPARTREAAIVKDWQRYERGDLTPPKETPTKAKETPEQTNNRLFLDERRVGAWLSQGPGAKMGVNEPTVRATRSQLYDISARRHEVITGINQARRAQLAAERTKTEAKAARAEVARVKRETVTAQKAAKSATIKYKGNDAFEAINAGRSIAVRTAQGGNLIILKPVGRADDQGRVSVQQFFGGAKKPEGEPHTLTAERIAEIVQANGAKTTVLPEGWKPPTYTAKSPYAQLVKRYTQAATAVPRSQLRGGQIKNVSERYGTRIRATAEARMARLEAAILAGPQRATKKRSAA